MQRQFVFNESENAADFLQDIMQSFGGGAGKRRNLSGLPIHRIQEVALNNKGTPWYRSHHERETFLHNRFQRINEEDREYLYKRMPLAKALCKMVARDCWFEPPETGNASLDALFSRIRDMGFNRVATAADARQRRSGYSFIYINASGSPSESIENQPEWFGFDYIHPGMIDWSKTEFSSDPSDPLLSAGILRLHLRPDGLMSEAGAEGIVIHGSRLIPLCEDEDARNIVNAESMLDVIHDSLWDLLDIQFSRNNAQVSGNPIVIELDTESVTDIDDDEAQEVMDMAVEVRAGARDAFGPIKGLNMKRIGKSDLDDPEWGLRLTVGSIASVTEYSANQIMPFSRGSRQMEPEDDLEYLSAIMVRNTTFLRTAYARLVMLARVSRFAPRRIPPLPAKINWPYLRFETPKSEVFKVKGMSQALAQAASAGRRLPDEHDGKWPEDEELRKAMLAVQTVNDIKPRSIAEVMAELEAELRAEAFAQE